MLNKMPVPDTKKHSICGIHLEKQEFSLEKNLRNDREVLNERRALKFYGKLGFQVLKQFMLLPLMSQFSLFILK